MKYCFMMSLSAGLASFCLLADGPILVPRVSNVALTQAANRDTTVSYVLADGPAIVTLDLQTNTLADATGDWVSIGAENFSFLVGDVNGVVSNGARSISWSPTWSHQTDASGLRAVLTAWSPDDPPPYMVVDLALSVPAGRRVSYYPTEGALPGGILSNSEYRLSKIVLRKICAAGVEWSMGSLCEPGRNTSANGLKETLHRVMLTNDYYIGVFPITQAQWSNLSAYKKADYKVEGRMRPMESICFNAVRCCATSASTVDPGCDYPNPPHESSFLGLLYARTGIAFDLPGEAQWEYACRAGHGDGYWGTGDPILSDTEDPNFPGRYRYNHGVYDYTTDTDFTVGPTNGTPIVGTYAPNSWGLYDMCGGVREMCLDWGRADITALNGEIVAEQGEATERIIRGGDFKSKAGVARPAFRDTGKPTNERPYVGFRVVCPIAQK